MTLLERPPDASRLRLGFVGIAIGTLLLACAPEAITPEPPPPPEPALQPAPEPDRPSPESDLIRAYFATQEASLVARGLMRTDGGGPDTPFTTSMLTNNFVRIALFDEYVEAAGRLVARPTPASLRRWETPVRMRLEFSPSIPPEQRRQDTADVRGYAARLARVTGHPVSLVTGEAQTNFHILVLDETTRRDYGDRLAELVPEMDALSISTITGMPRTASCLVLAFARSGTHTYTQAVAVVRAELPDLTRLACYHEELAQGMGLPNDAGRVRPSIFNDTQEFARLTPHDELLLRILYDDRLRPGTTEAEARPIVQAIARELTGGS